MQPFCAPPAYPTFVNFYNMVPENKGHVAKTHGVSMDPNFAWQLIGSIWLSYGTIGLLDWLEVGYIKNGLKTPVLFSTT